MAMARRILILFPDEWDRAAVRDPRYAGEVEFLHEGLDLFSFPDNARLFTFDALRFVDRVAAKYARARVDAVVTSDEQFGPFLAALVSERLGLPHSPLEAVLTLQHKYYARLAFERVAPEANARMALLRRAFGGGGRPSDVAMRFPFYVKPAKAAYSVLARRVDRFEDLHAHTRFGWFERAIIERLVRPFADVMRARSELTEDPFSMVCEEILPGRQVTANGFVRNGEVTMMGTVDSMMYPGTDQFQRFQYPSSLPAGALRRVDELAERLVKGVGYTHGMFNAEMRIDPADGRPRVIEINPRAAGQFYDLFERVDGYNPFDAMIDLHAGLAPRLARGQGRDRHAASFVLRDLRGAGLSRWPSRAELQRLQRRNGDVHAMIYPKRGADLARELKWLGSYRYAVFNLGAPTEERLFERFRRLCAQVTFHPPGHALAGIVALAEPASGDD
jgi:hypothetical protein